MHKFLVVLLSIMVLSLGAAFAQQDEDIDASDLAISAQAGPFGTTQYAGGSLGLPLLQGYYGLQDAFLGSDLRFRVGLTPVGGFGFTAGADLLYDFTTFGDDNEFTLYGGGGPSLRYIGGSIANTGYNFFAIDLTGVGGVNYRLDPDISLFGEAGLGLGFGFNEGAIAGQTYGGLFLPIRVALGANYHF